MISGVGSIERHILTVARTVEAQSATSSIETFESLSSGRCSALYVASSREMCGPEAGMRGEGLEMTTREAKISRPILARSAKPLFGRPRFKMQA
jgi:hypothetical protein